MVLVSNTLHQIKRGSLSFRERYLSLRKEEQPSGCSSLRIFPIHIRRKRMELGLLVILSGEIFGNVDKYLPLQHLLLI